MEAIAQHATNAATHLAWDETDPWIPAPKVAEQFGISRRTLARWICDEQLRFPQATVLNHRLYFRQREIDTWKLERARLSTREAA